MNGTFSSHSHKGGLHLGTAEARATMWLDCVSYAVMMFLNGSDAVMAFASASKVASHLRKT